MSSTSKNTSENNGKDTGRYGSGTLMRRLALINYRTDQAGDIAFGEKGSTDLHLAFMILVAMLLERIPDTVRTALTFWKLGIADGIGELLMELGVIMRTDGLPVLLFTVILYLAQPKDGHDWDRAFEGGLWAWFPAMMIRILFKVPIMLEAMKPYIVAGFPLEEVLAVAVGILNLFVFWRVFSGAEPYEKELSETIISRYSKSFLLILGIIFVSLYTIYVPKLVPKVMPLGVGEPAPAFTLPADDGSQCTLEPGRPHLLVFWSTQCPVCREEMRILPELKEFADNVYLIHTWGGKAVSAQARAVAGSLPFKICLDDGRVSEKYLVRSIPYMVITDSQGRLAEVFRGRTSASTLRAALKKVSASQKASK